MEVCQEGEGEPEEVGGTDSSGGVAEAQNDMRQFGEVIVKWAKGKVGVVIKGWAFS